MKEVAVNQGMNINLSQNIKATQTLAQDQAIIPKTSSQSLSLTPEKEPDQVTKSSQEWKKGKLSEQQKARQPPPPDQVKGQKEQSEPKVKVEDKAKEVIKKEPKASSLLTKKTPQILSPKEEALKIRTALEKSRTDSVAIKKD